VPGGSRPDGETDRVFVAPSGPGSAWEPADESNVNLSDVDRILKGTYDNIPVNAAKLSNVSVSFTPDGVANVM
jgi:hypothetical protein